MNSKKIAMAYVEEHAVRLIALQVVIITLLVLYTRSYWLAAALGVDFAIRSFTYVTSPLAFVVKTINRFVPWERKPVFAAPKKFAAGIGFGFAMSLAILLYLGFNTAANIVAGVLLPCAVLESFFKVCVGCYVYDWVIAPFKK